MVMERFSIRHAVRGIALCAGFLSAFSFAQAGEPIIIAMTADQLTNRPSRGGINESSHLYSHLC